MNKTELIEELSSQTRLSKVDSKLVLESLIKIFEKSLRQGASVVLTGFGTFSVAKRKAKTGVNPITKKPMQIPAKNVAKFKAGKELKEALNK